MNLRTSPALSGPAVRLLPWTAIALAAVALAGCGSSRESASATTAAAGARGTVEECVDRWNDWAPDLPEHSVTRQQLDAIIHESHDPIVLMAESSSLAAYCSVSIFINGPYGRFYVSGHAGEAFSLNRYPVNGPPAPYEGRTIVEAEITRNRRIDHLSTDGPGLAASEEEQPGLTRPDNSAVQPQHADAYLQGRDLGSVVMAQQLHDVEIPTGQVIHGTVPASEIWNRMCEEFVQASLQLGALVLPSQPERLKFDATDPEQVSAFLAGCTDVWLTATEQQAGSSAARLPQPSSPPPSSPPAPSSRSTLRLWQREQASGNRTEAGLRDALESLAENGNTLVAAALKALDTHGDGYAQALQWYQDSLSRYLNGTPFSADPSRWGFAFPSDPARFHTPSGNITCEDYPLKCRIASGFVPLPSGALRCGDSSDVVTLGRTGTATVGCVDVGTGGARLLPYGASWDEHGVHCVSHETQLVCTNAEGYGFALSREGSRLIAPRAPGSPVERLRARSDVAAKAWNEWRTEHPAVDSPFLKYALDAALALDGTGTSGEIRDATAAAKREARRALELHAYIYKTGDFGQAYDLMDSLDRLRSQLARLADAVQGNQYDPPPVWQRSAD